MNRVGVQCSRVRVLLMLLPTGTSPMYCMKVLAKWKGKRDRWLSKIQQVSHSQVNLRNPSHVYRWQNIPARDPPWLWTQKSETVISVAPQRGLMPFRNIFERLEPSHLPGKWPWTYLIVKQFTTLTVCPVLKTLIQLWYLVHLQICYVLKGIRLSCWHHTIHKTI